MPLVSENPTAGVSHKVPHKVFSGLVCHIHLELFFGAIVRVFSILNIKRFTTCKITKTG